MSEFEYLRNVTIGQYLPTGSRIHRLDPRVKLLAVILLLIGTVLCNSLIGLVITLIGAFGALAVAHIPIRYGIRGLRPALAFMLFLALLQVLVISQNDAGIVLWRWWQIVITLTDLRVAAITLLRFAVLILLLSLFSFSTRITELTNGLDHLVQPLQRVGLPAHEFALTVIIALRFVPLLALEAEHLAKAQASRGADWGRRGQINVLARTRQMLPLLVPLFIAALRRAETLALAMEARCYTGGKGRTRLVHLEFKPGDLVTLSLVLAWVLALLAVTWLGVDLRIWRWMTNVFLG